MGTARREHKPSACAFNYAYVGVILREDMVAISMKCSMIGLTPFTYAYLSHVPTWSNSVISRGRRKTEGFDIVMSLMLSVRPSTARFVSLCLRRKSGLWLDRQHEKEHMFFMPRLGIIFFCRSARDPNAGNVLAHVPWLQSIHFFFSTRILFFRSRLNFLILLPTVDWKYYCEYF